MWDLWHDARNSTELANALVKLHLPNEIAHALFAAKQSVEPKPSALERAVEAIKSLAALDPKVLEAAESHGTVLKHIADALMKE